MNRVVAGVEHEQGRDVLFEEAADEILHLSGGHIVGILIRANPPGVGERHPGVAGKGQSRDELIGPTRDDGLPGGVAGGMVVVAASGTAFGIAAGPHRGVHRVNRGAVRLEAVVEGLRRQQLP